MSVTRYDPAMIYDFCADEYAGMEIFTEGDYVEYAEYKKLYDELADANNSFGSQTALWAGLAQRIEVLKSNCRASYRRSERLEDCLAEIMKQTPHESVKRMIREAVGV